ncbi:zinc finger protein 839, partial [Fukomys damarensis]|uniref:zinc finger protein 839 n=1 Tax=Fukomys damarensis TaxID=885580 RepID=UPI00053F6C52
LLPPQQLEAICVRVTSGDKKGQERPVRPSATTQPQTGGQCLLPGSWPNPRGLGVQSEAPWGPMLAKRVKTAPALSGQGAMLTPLPASALAAPGSVHLSPAGWHTECAKKLKKSLKVKTRSGRVSRPPKYKAKDYKFIKTKDLVDGRPSDSDDYAELSAGDEEEQQDPWALFAAASCALRPRAFQCPACDKAYIGQGGLARHWRLNPGHGQLQPTPSPEKGHLASLEPPTLPAPGQDRAEAAQGGPQDTQYIEGEEAMVLEPENGSHSALAFPRGDTEGPAEPGTTGVLQNGAARPCGGRAVATGPTTCRSRAQLWESLQQCGPEDLVELVLPRLAQVVTVYEFLLAKTKEGGAGQPRFPAVYKEFEELHSRVKTMCQEHLGRAPATPEPLEIIDPQVAESLGITEFLKKTEAHPHCTAAWCHSRQGVHESAQEVPVARRSWGSFEAPAAHGGGWEMPGLCVPTAGEGCAPPHCEGSCGMTVSGGDRSVSHPHPQFRASADSEARRGPSGPAVPCGDGCRPAPCAQLGEPEDSFPDPGAAPGSPGVFSTPSPVGEAEGARHRAPPHEELLPVDCRPGGCADRSDPDGSPLTTGSCAGGPAASSPRDGLGHVVAVGAHRGF